MEAARKYQNPFEVKTLAEKQEIAEKFDRTNTLKKYLNFLEWYLQRSHEKQMKNQEARIFAQQKVLEREVTRVPKAFKALDLYRMRQN